MPPLASKRAQLNVWSSHWVKGRRQGAASRPASRTTIYDNLCALSEKVIRWLPQDEEQKADGPMGGGAVEALTGRATRGGPAA